MAVKNTVDVKQLKESEKGRGDQSKLGSNKQHKGFLIGMSLI